MIVGTLLVIGLVASLMPVIKCWRPDCYTQIQETRRCLSIARSGPYPPSVAKHYEERLDHWPCNECHGNGRVTIARIVWKILTEPLLSRQ